MLISKVESALRQHLAAMLGVPPIQYENVEYRASGTYCKATVLPAEIVTPALGLSAPQRYEGIFQVSVFTPAGKGTKTADDLVSLLLSRYPRGTSLVYSGVSVLILKSWRGPGIDGESYFQIPVSIRFQSYLEP
jgi:hypothetical protein